MPEDKLLLDYVAWWIGFIVIMCAVNFCLAYWPVTTIIGIFAWAALEIAITKRKVK